MARFRKQQIFFCLDSRFRCTQSGSHQELIYHDWDQRVFWCAIPELAAVIISESIYPGTSFYDRMIIMAEDLFDLLASEFG